MWDSLTPRKSVPPKILIVSLLIHTDRTRIKRSLSLILVQCTNRKDTRKPVTSPNPSTPYLHLGLNHCGPTRGPRVQSSLESAGKEVQGMNAGQLHTSFHQRKDYWLSHFWELCCDYSRPDRFQDLGRWKKMCGGVGMLDMSLFKDGRSTLTASCVSPVCPCVLQCVTQWEAPNSLIY